MGNLSFVVWIVILPADHGQRMAESPDVHEFVVNGKEHSPCKEPNQYERYGLSPSDGHLDENHFHDDVGDGLHDAIDSIVEGHGGF